MRTERTGARFLRFGHPRCKPGANLARTCLVQVPRQLDRRLHLHVVLEEAAAERGVVVGLARLGLDGRLVPGLRHLRRHGPDAAHGGV